MATQIKVFIGQEQYENTKQYIEKYCKATPHHHLSATEMKLCVGIVNHWTTTATLMEGIIVKFIALLRLSDIENNVDLANAKRAVLLHHREKTKNFLRDILFDTTDYCTNGGYGIYGCLANGENVLLNDGHWFKLTNTQRDLFRTHFGIEDDFVCRNKGKTLTNCGK